MDGWIITGLIFVGAALVMYLCVKLSNDWLDEVHMPPSRSEQLKALLPDMKKLFGVEYTRYHETQAPYKIEKPDLEGAKRAVNNWDAGTPEPKKKRAYVKRDKVYWKRKAKRK